MAKNIYFRETLMTSLRLTADKGLFFTRKKKKKQLIKIHMSECTIKAANKYFTTIC